MVNRVLFLMEKYCDANPACGPTASESQIVGAIKSTGLVRETKRFYFDVISQQLGRDRMSALLREDCQVFQPELIIYTPMGGSPLEPSRETIAALGIKVYVIHFDAKPAAGFPWPNYATYVGIVDSITAFNYYKHIPNVIIMYAAVDPNSYYYKNLARDIDISFVGTIDPTDRTLALRNEYTSFLKANGIDILIGGAQRNKRLSPEECGNIFNRSKIALNFCRNGSMPMLKSKVFEIIACKTFMLEDWDTHTTYFLEPGKDFVIYHSKEELLKLVRYYLVHDEEREAIARSGHEKVTKIYNARNMWGYIFERMGFTIPDKLAKDEDYKLHKEIMEHFYAQDIK